MLSPYYALPLFLFCFLFLYSPRALSFLTKAVLIMRSSPPGKRKNEKLGGKKIENRKQMLVVEDDVPAVPETVFFGKNASGSPSSSASLDLEILPYSSPRAFAWWRDYQEEQASASPLRDDHARAWVSAADALLSDGATMKRLREWAPDAVVGDTAYLATYGLAAVLGGEAEGGEEGGEEEKTGSDPEAAKRPRLSPPPPPSPPSSPSPPPPPPPRRRGLPFATVSCTGIVDPVHGWLMRFENDASVIPQFGSGLRAPMVRFR